MSLGGAPHGFEVLVDWIYFQTLLDEFDENAVVAQAAFFGDALDLLGEPGAGSIVGQPRAAVSLYEWLIDSPAPT